MKSREKTIRLALAGNPNSGKTSLFNALTGAHQNVGNYPGVTVERREGRFTFQGQTFEVLDLPGTYSLSSYSPEERIAQEELLKGNRDVTVVVVDSTTLRRSLVLLAQILSFDVNPVLCLNFTDDMKKSGQKLDIPLMESLLGLPVVQTTGHKRIGIDTLKETIARASEAPIAERRLVLGEELKQALTLIETHLRKTALDQNGAGWIATRLLIDDPSFVDQVRALGPEGEKAVEEAGRHRRRLEALKGIDITLYLSEQYYGFVNGLLKEVEQLPPQFNTRIISDRIDTVLVNRLLGLPIFALIMFGIFWLTFTLGEIPTGWLDDGFTALKGWISGFWAPGSDSAVRSLLVDGIIGGVGGVLVFLPNIVLLFLGLALLEDTGYLARAAYIMDRLMHRFGLHGKSFIPMLIGFGCSIPGIMATRTLENERDRLVTMLVLPLMSCGARLPIWTLLIPAFFAQNLRALMLWVIYMVGIMLALALALLLKKTVLKGEEAPFVMEMPPYRLPPLKAVIIKMGQRAWIYLRKAGTIILAISIVMWFLVSYPKTKDFKVDRAIKVGGIQVVKISHSRKASPGEREKKTEQVLKAARAKAPRGIEVLSQDMVEARRASETLQGTVAGHIGRFIEPALSPLGFDWKIGTALIGAFAAKELFVAQMGIVYSIGKVNEGSARLREALRKDYSPLVGFSLMLFLLIATPCMATLAVVRRESGSWKWPLLQFCGLTAIAYVLSLLVYQIGSLFM